MRRVNVWNGDERILEVAAGAEEVVGVATLRAYEGDAGADLRPRHPGQARRTKVDRRAVGAGAGGGDAGATHGTGVLLVDAKPLC